MKKFVAILLALMLILSISVPVFAVTPPLNPPASPTVPEIEVDVELPDGFWDRWFKDHPIKLPTTTEPEETAPAETEPPETEPAVTELEAPTVTEARFYHSGISRLQIQWTEVDYAEHYVVLIVKADGTVSTYVTDDNTLFLNDAACPKVYIEHTRTWTAATVRVMAVTGDTLSEWCAPKKIGCDALHSS